VPAKVVKIADVRVANSQLDHIHIPDPVAQELCRMRNEISELKKQLQALQDKDNG